MNNRLYILLISLAVTACGGANGERKSNVAAAMSPDYGPPVVVGTIEAPEIKESSGLAVSRCQPNVLWTHNDGGEPQIFAMTPEGKHLGAWRVPNARKADWEDIAIYKDPVGKCFLLIGNIGDNDQNRNDLEIYRVAEPAAGAENAGTTDPAEILRFAYPDGPRNAESLLVHPSGDIYIVSKRETGPAAVYRLKPVLGADVQTAEKITDMSVPADPPGRFTGGAISPDGSRVMLCNVQSGYEFVMPAGADFAAVWKQQPKVVDLGKRKQGEAVSYNADGTSVYASSERKDAPIIRVVRR